MEDGDLSDTDSVLLDADRLLQPRQYHGGARNVSSESDDLLRDPERPLNPVPS